MTKDDRIRELEKALDLAWELSGRGETDGFGFASFPCCTWCGAILSSGFQPHPQTCPITLLKGGEKKGQA